MKVVIYSSNTCRFDADTFHYSYNPANSMLWNSVLKDNTDLEIFFITQTPSLFLLDINSKTEILSPENVKTIVLPECSAEEFANEIIKIKPDFAFAASYWITPFDWLPLKDSLIGEYLEENNIKTICHYSNVANTFFNKQETVKALKEKGFTVAESLFVNHSLFWTERSRPEIFNNAYKEYIFKQIKKMNLPVVIKDTVGLSSFGMDVLNTYGEIKNYLTSKKNNGDRLIEEYIPGLQFGLEIYGYDNQYFVTDPFMFSVNQYGITSPKQSVKVGPVKSEKYKISELKNNMLQLAQTFNLRGIAQVDLVYNLEEEKWYIIEINPRLSGMTQTLCCSSGVSVQQLIVDLIKKNYTNYKYKYTCALKFPLLDDSFLKELYELPFVMQVNQTKNDLAKQKRECGYCEVIFGGFEQVADLENSLEALKNKFPEIMEEVFYLNAKELIEKLK